jgi:hypothetical protein
VRNHLSEGMRIAALHHTKMAGELATLRTVESYTAEFALAQQNLSGGSCGQVGCRIPEARGAKLAP